MPIALKLRLVFLVGLATTTTMADERDDFFEAKIRPVLAGTCFRCHGETKTGGGLRIDSREQLTRGGESGPAIVPGNPAESLLIQAIRRDADVSAMPPEKDKALRAEQVADFVTWVQTGAHWPEKTARFEAARHWAFEPVREVPLPVVQQTGWEQTTIDRFILAHQEAASVKPAPRADKRTLIRRATFDLTGLPPTPAEMDAFLQDETPDAFTRVVDRLLKSPAYGERWGRHWLDVVRYADTAGETADYPVPLAWRYRNYVIDAFNADKPYDQFLREQIAGDILAQQGPAQQYAERVTATGYLAISRRFGFDSENYHHLTIQDTIDTLGQSVLGLSLGCARCHDHKFDAVTMRDYYGLYGIFDSSRYAFPGSEQKQKFRAMTPLLPPEESSAQWRAYESRVAALVSRLTKQKQPVPAAVFRSLSEMDGDFELQAPASGGSNGVLVPPWLYTGPVAITTAAQSPFKHVYPQGRVGASIAAGPVSYRIKQALRPSRGPETSVFVSLDFRVGPPDAGQSGEHRFTLGGRHGDPAIDMRLSSREVALHVDGTRSVLAAIPANQWQNLQLTIDLAARTVSGQVGSPGAITEFTAKPLGQNSDGVLEQVTLASDGGQEASRPGIEYDNLAVQTIPFGSVSTELNLPTDMPPALDFAAITAEIQQLSGIDGDFELQSADASPSTPWGPGPNSVVKVSAKSQSPFGNLYPRGELGLFMPNRGEYDGFGMAVPNIKPDQDGRVFAAFDFRCASQDAGGNGTWRYYLGHGPGNSAAVELFFNGKEFFRRSGDAREPIAAVTIGEWYQVQMTLNLPAKTYTGTLFSRDSKTEFNGQLAAGWDGTLDYTFIDSYGHIGGVRPALDADNFVISDQPLSPFDVTPSSAGQSDPHSKRQKVRELRRQLASAQQQLDRDKQELETLLNEGPFAMTYGMTEGTPHDVPIQMRGEPDRPGEVAPRGFIKSIGGHPLPQKTAGSGRLELAEWLTRPDHPLTARVMANRLWQYHFGRGLVKTPNDFGVRGLPPTHSELLDHLATQFVRSGWSIKAMHRLIMLSATYQQASTKDSMNDLYVGFPRRRLSAEEIRDTILTVSGELDSTPGREHPFPPATRWGYTQHGPFSAVYDHNRRSVYLMTQRLKRHPFLALFDGPDPNASTADRLGTTVPTQALFFLNDPFVHEKADRWAGRLLAIADESERLAQAWRTACGRLPTNAERTEAHEFLTAYRQELTATKTDNVEQRALAAYLRTLIGSNEFLHVD